MAEGEPTFWDKLKANPTMMVAMILTIVGVFVSIYGYYKKSKYVKYAGIGLTAGAAFTAIGAYVYGEYKAGQETRTGTTGITSQYGMSGQSADYVVTTPE